MKLFLFTFGHGSRGGRRKKFGLKNGLLPSLHGPLNCEVAASHIVQKILNWVPSSRLALQSPYSPFPPSLLQKDTDDFSEGTGSLSITFYCLVAMTIESSRQCRVFGCICVSYFLHICKIKGIPIPPAM